MKILFCLDVKLLSYKGSFYTSGAADYNYFKSFMTENTEQMIVFCRKRNVNSINSKMSKASGPKLKILGINSYKDLIRKSIRNELNLLIKDADYYLIKQPSFIGNFVCHILRKNKINYFVNMVGCPWDALTNRGFLSKIVAPFMYLITKHYVKNSKAVIYVTNEFLQKKYPTNGRQIGCSDVLIDEKNTEILAQRIDKINLLNSNKNIVIGTIGAIDVNYKGQQYVIQAISELNKNGYNITYQLIGSGDKSNLQKIAEKFDVLDNVVFLGSIPHDKIFDWLKEIDLYIQPSDAEGLCRSIIEAMSMACPIIVSNVGGNPELINQDYLFEKGNIKQLVEIIKKMDKSTMQLSAKENYNNSKKYNKNELHKKKNEFLREIMDKNNN